MIKIYLHACRMGERSYRNNAISLTHNIHSTFSNTVLKINLPFYIENPLVTTLLLAFQRS